MAVLRGFPVQGVVACFDEPNQVGDWWNIDAPRNAPAKNPGAHLSSVYWHSEFFQYELAMPIQSVSVSHPALAGRTQTYGGAGFWTSLPAIVGVGQSSATNHTLVTHSLGFVPLVMVAQNGVLITPGHIVQSQSAGRTRSVTAYATTSIVGLRDVMKSNDSALSATTLSYQVLVLRQRAQDGGKPLFGKSGDHVVVGRGKADTSRQYLRRVGSGDTPFVMPLGPVGDIANGRRRVVLGGTTITEADYTGSFTGPASITVGT